MTGRDDDMPQPSLQSKTILVVEDDWISAQALKAQLEDEGAIVPEPVASVGDAIAFLSGAPAIDAAVLDVNLGDEMVFPVATELSRHSIPFAFVTGQDRTPVAVRYSEVPIFEKPVQARALVQALQEQIRARRG